MSSCSVKVVRIFGYSHLPFMSTARSPRKVKHSQVRERHPADRNRPSRSCTITSLAQTIDRSHVEHQVYLLVSGSNVTRNSYLKSCYQISPDAAVAIETPFPSGHIFGAASRRRRSRTPCARSFEAPAAPTDPPTGTKVRHFDVELQQTASCFPLRTISPFLCLFYYSRTYFEVDITSNMLTKEIVGFNKPLDEKLYSLSAGEVETFRALTGIDEEQELKAHILSVQAKAYAVHAYPCIRYFEFLRMTIAHLPAYNALLELGRTRADALFLDVGCCFGNDARKAILDGYPMHNVLASDLHPEFWDLGHELFKTSPKSFPVPFFPGDLFDPAFLTPAPGASPPSSPSSPSSFSSSSSSGTLISTDTSTTRTLTPHLTRARPADSHLPQPTARPQEQQLQLAHALASLLSPAPGSFIFGQHSALPTKGRRAEVFYGQAMFCHSPDSWKELWDGEVFEKGTVKVETELAEVKRDFPGFSPDARFWVLTWSVTRLEGKA
ncbi:hypothetical protein EVG20_g7726 [Dentipellis fragilis]|uniref:Methyltransferase domain-containing protein n=1 Tax=Dentipellis fragilis TaxID=205917 RepID=A0A4Y9YAL8_9AGAM|nr:hypothetical protein EVG20_g7726 [Dentipellis fragilis]